MVSDFMRPPPFYGQILEQTHRHSAWRFPKKLADLKQFLFIYFLLQIHSVLLNMILLCNN